MAKRDRLLRLDPDPDRVVLGVFAAMVLLLVPIAHLPLARSAYIQDDRLAVEANPIVARANPIEILSTNYWEGVEGADETLYRPTVIGTFALERRLVGRPDPRVAHAVNVALHAAASLALLALLLRAGARPVVSGIATLLFSVHPIHVEAVGGIVGRAEILAAGSSFAALALAIRALDRRASDGRRRLAAWAAGLLVLLALGAKEVALATPVLMLALAALAPKGPRDSWRATLVDRAVALMPTVAAVATYGLLRIRATATLAGLQEVHPFDNPLVALDGLERAPTALAIVGRYAGLLVAPFGLSADYSGQAVPLEATLLAFRPLLGLAILVGLGVLLALPLLRPSSSSRLLCFSSLLFLAPYLIVGNLFFDIGAVMAERLLYMPSAGFCAFAGLLLGGAIERGANAPGLRPRLATFAAGTLVAGLALQTWARCHDWRDEETLFRAATSVRAASPRALLILGRIEAQRGELSAALDSLDRAVAAYPALFAAWLERGSVLGQLGRIVEARDAFARAVEHGPLHPMGHLNLGIAESRLNRPDAAERALRKALLHDPRLDKAWAQLGNLALARGDRDRAVSCYRRAIGLGRRDLEPRLAEALALP